MDEDDVFDGYGVSVTLPHDRNFTLIMETLTRIGQPIRSDKKLLQCCHIFHKRGQYALMHWREMLYFDGKDITLTDEEITKRDSIARLLEQWNLLAIDEEVDTEFNLNGVMVVPYRDKDEWKLVPRYEIGSRKHRQHE